MTETANLALVRRHLDGFAHIPTYIDAIAETVTEDLVWFNSGFPTQHGLDAARDMLRSFGKRFGGIRIENVHMAAEGDRVWTERIDYQLKRDGSVAFDLPCMGIFEIRDGRIARWRDYFDPSMFK